ncbi:MAG TPA: adenylate/guanylate cyclase domain-containing protein [Dongiaceae bacterium]
MAVFTGLVVVTASALAAAISNLGSRIVEELVDRRFQTIAESSAVEIAGVMDAATGVLHEQIRLASHDLLPFDNSAELGRRFAERLRQERQLAWISYGEPERDSFVGATRRADGFLSVNRSENGIDNGRPSEIVEQADGSWKPVGGEGKKPYSVVAQRWFADASATDAIVVTGPYTFAEGIKGITLSLRWSDADRRVHGVFTVDFFLSQLSRMLAVLAGDSGDAVLLDANNQLLANAGAVRAPSLAEAAQAAFAANRDSVLAMDGGGSLATDVDSPDGALRASITRIQSSLGVQWVLVVLEPRATLFAPLRQLHLVIIAVSAAVVLLGLAAAILLAGRLARPLAELSVEAERIRDFDLDDPITTRSIIVELAKLIDAMRAMKAGLRSFAHFVPKRVVKRLIAAGGAATLGGNRRELTLLFSDIAGFTNLSEGLPPEQVMRRISHYFDVMSDAIHANQGIVDKYIGDAIMAIWNAPRHDADHAANGCRALLACMKANDAHDQEAIAAGLPPLPTRFGLHTGEAIIGNIGSTDRMQYTALGANVNLASRLEPLNKHYGTRNLVSAETRARAGNAFLFRSVANVQPVGTSRPMEVFELMGAADVPDAPALRERMRQWEIAISALREGRATEALQLFQAIAATRPAGGLAAYYVRKSAEIARRPPEMPWDGIDEFSTK